MVTVVISAILGLAGLVAVLYYKSQADVASAQLVAATQAAVGAAQRAQQLTGALAALKAKLDDESNQDTAQGKAAAGSASGAADYLRDSVNVPGGGLHPVPVVVAPSPVKPAARLVSAALGAHPARFVTGFGRW